MSLLSPLFLELYQRSEAWKIRNAKERLDTILASPKHRCYATAASSAAPTKCPAVPRDDPPPPRAQPRQPSNDARTSPIWTRARKKQRQRPDAIDSLGTFGSTPCERLESEAPVSNNVSARHQRTIEWVNSHLTVGDAAHDTAADVRAFNEPSMHSAKVDEKLSSKVITHESTKASVEMPPPPAPPSKKSSAMSTRSKRKQTGMPPAQPLYTDDHSDSGFVDDSAGMTFVMRSWFVRPKKTSVCVDGFCSDGSGNLEPRKSSLIVKRVGARKVQSATGNTYVLVGNVDEAASLDYGLSGSFVEKFSSGFPRDWEAFVEKHRPPPRKRRHNRSTRLIEGEISSFSSAILDSSLDVSTLPKTRSGLVRYPRSDAGWTEKSLCVSLPICEKLIKENMSTNREPSNEPSKSTRQSQRDISVIVMDEESFRESSAVVGGEDAGAKPTRESCRKTIFSDVACQTECLALANVACQTELSCDEIQRGEDRPHHLSKSRPTTDDVGSASSVERKRPLAAKKSRPIRRKVTKKVARASIVTSSSLEGSDLVDIGPRATSRSRPIREYTKSVQNRTDSRANIRTNAKKGADRIDNRNEPIVTNRPTVAKNLQRPSGSQPERPNSLLKDVEKVEIASTSNRVPTTIANRNTLRFQRQLREFVATESRCDDSDGDDLFSATPYRNSAKIAGLANLRLDCSEDGDQEDDDNDADGDCVEQTPSSSRRFLLPVSAKKTPSLHTGASPYFASIDNPLKRQREIERYIWNRKNKRRKEMSKNKPTALLLPPSQEPADKSSVGRNGGACASSSRNTDFRRANKLFQTANTGGDNEDEVADEEEDDEPDFYFSDDD